MNRRTFVKTALAATTTAAAPWLLSGCGSKDGATGSATRTASGSGSGSGGGGDIIRIGFIPLTDCASVVMADKLGLYKKHGLNVEVTKEASWANVRDKLLTGELNAAHCLFGMPFSVYSGVAGENVKGKELRVAMMLNSNGQAITLGSDMAAQAKYGDLAGAKAAIDAMKAAGKTPTFAMTFPGGTHDLWLRYWLAAAGVDAKQDVKIVTIPPPQMVANMKVGNMNGYCVGEPWGGVAVKQNIGFTHIATQDIWKDHPEKALGTTADFVKKYPNTARAVTAAIIEAGKWIDAGLQNKSKMAETVADKAYVNTSVDAINQRILGRYQNGMGKTWDDPNHMKFFNDGQVGFPYLTDGMWFLTQHKRWGLLKDHPDYLGVARQINQIDLYKQAAAAAKVSVPRDPMRASKMVDGVVWDGKDPKKYADSFKVHA
jgi:nitrate/nitrite transport system substrate-binding protein